MDLASSRLALKAAAGVAAGLLFWIALSPVYDPIVARAATVVIRAFERPAVTRLRQVSSSRFIVDRRDFDPRSSRPALEIRTLTANFVLLTMLFALNRRPFSDRNVAGFVAACAVLFVTQVFGVISNVMSIYALQLGVWSTVHYSAFERNFWGAASHSYGLVLMYGFAIAAWWAFRSPAPEPEPSHRQSRTARRKIS